MRATVGGVAGIGVVGKARAEKATLTGRLVSYDDQPINRGEVYFTGGAYHSLNSEGRFSAEVDSYSEVGIALYKRQYAPLAPIRNDIPHVYGLGDYGTGTGRDLGTISVPRGYLIQMRALDANGDPVEDAQPHLRHEGHGTADYTLTTNSNGYMQISDTDFTGLELRGSVEATMTIPSDGDTERLNKSIDFNSSAEVIFQVDEGVTVRDSSTDTESQTTASTNTVTQSTTDPSVPSTTSAPTASPTTRPTPTTAPTGSPTTTRSPVPTQTTDAGATPRSTTGESRPQRGFLSNGNPGELSFLSNPFFLTVGGFVLSVGGIFYQLVQGD